jgi:hypothetical protein
VLEVLAVIKTGTLGHLARFRPRAVVDLPLTVREVVAVLDGQWLREHVQHRRHRPRG